MGDVITALQNTPLPTILVVGGIVFLLLAVAGQFVGKIKVPKERQVWAGLIGFLLLFFGVALYVAPVSPSVSTPTAVAAVTPVTQQSVPSGTPSVKPVDTQPSNLDFEADTSGWGLYGSRPEDYTIGSDSTIVHGGQASGYIRSIKENIDGFGTLVQTVTAKDFRGERLRMSAYAKTEGVDGWAGLWMRVDTPAGIETLDNMGDRPILGDTPWTPYEIVLDVPEDCTYIHFGILVDGTGQAWVDDFRFEVVGQDVPTTQ